MQVRTENCRAGGRANPLRGPKSLAQASFAATTSVVAANEACARDFGPRSGLALPPARQFSVLTCMDARLDPAKYSGLAEGDAHVIRNAGGRATNDAIRSS